MREKECVRERKRQGQGVSNTTPSIYTMFYHFQTEFDSHQRRCLQRKGRGASNSALKTCAISQQFETDCVLPCWQAAKIPDGECCKPLGDACDVCCKACNGVRTYAMAHVCMNAFIYVSVYTRKLDPNELKSLYATRNTTWDKYRTKYVNAKIALMNERLRTHTHTHTQMQVCDPCFYHGSHTFAYSDDSTEMKNVTIDSLTERTVGRNDMAWGLMDEMVCKYGTCLY